MQEDNDTTQDFLLTARISEEEDRIFFKVSYFDKILPYFICPGRNCAGLCFQISYTA